MEEELLLLCAYLARKKELIERRRSLRNLREANTPFSMPDAKFIETFRLPKSICLDLIRQLEPHDAQSSNIPFTLRFLTALYFYAHGFHQKSVGNNFSVSLSQASVSRALFHITRLIVDKKRTEIRFPQTADEVAYTKSGFYESFGIKETIGAIDCSHVRIITPPGLNMRTEYKISVEAVCDHRLIFTGLNAKFPASYHDSSIWMKSPVRMYLLNRYNSENESWLLGDYKYPLEPWMLTPIATARNEKEEKFNDMHAKAHNVIRNAFGLLKSRFQCLSKERILHYGHERAATIVYACAILHNMLIKSGLEFDIEDIEESRTGNLDKRLKTEKPEGSEHLKEGEEVRTRYIMSL